MPIKALDQQAAPPCAAIAGDPAPAPTLTSTSAPAPTATPSGRGTPTVDPAPSGTGDCIVDVAPAEAFNALGMPHTFTFSCDNFVSTLTVPPGAIPSPGPGIAPGCYDVQATVTDVTTGSQVDIIAANCGGVGAPSLGSTVNCTSLANPICAAGFAPVGPGQCSACPPGFTYSTIDNQCHTSPVGGVCPPGTTPITNAAGSPIDCVEPTLGSVATTVNQVTVTINPGAPHVYRIDFSGYVGTTASGSCPEGTAPYGDVNYTPAFGIAVNNTTVTGPGCAFDVAAFKKYLEVTTLNILPIGTCAGTAPSQLQAQLGGGACLFRVQAIGMVILKTGVDCSTEPSGPVNTTPTPTTVGQEPLLEDGVDEYLEPTADEIAEGLAEGPDRTGSPNETYVCTNGSLELTRGVPNAQIDLTAVNGIFPGTGACLPPSLAPTAPTPTPTGSPAPTNTPTPTPAVPTPTNTPGPTPTPFTSSPPTAGVCQLTGSTSKVVTTDVNGVAPLVPPEIETAAIPDSNNPGTPGDCQYRPYVPGGAAGTHVFICGRIFAGDVGRAGALMSTMFNFPGGPPNNLACIPLQAPTDSEGRAFCEHPDVYGTEPGGDQVSVSVYFDLTGDLEGNFCQTQTYFVRAPAPPPFATNPAVTYCPTEDLGLAVVPTSFLPVGVIATAASIINTQPAVSSGLVTLGQQLLGTPTATAGPTSTPGPTATSTPVLTPTPTNTPVPTPSPTVTPTITPSPTATPSPTPTPIPTLRFSLDAARVAMPKNPGNRQGLDMVVPGQKVWLMMYYTLISVPKSVTRTTTYDIFLGKRPVFHVPFSGKEKAGTTGKFIRYTVVTFPRNTVPGLYVFRATLRLDGKRQMRNWRFAVVKGAPALYVARDVVLRE